MNLEHVLDWLVGALGAVVAWLAAQWRRLRDDLQAVEKKTAVLEARYDAVPSTLKEIKDEIKGLRTDVMAEMRALNERVDSKADR